MKKIPAKTIFTSPIHFLAFGFGSGLAPFAPGTFGTLAVLPFYWWLTTFDLSLYSYIGFCVFLSLIGIYICDISAKKLAVHDHPGIVWDEFVGFLITMTGFALTWQNLLLGFILFRFFDILKPWPIKLIDKKVAGGLGIMLDDILAGIFAWLSLSGINYGLNQLWY